ncbi:MAG: hypothetical protein WCB19_01605, partial [Thermoplasmata archaeon]
PSAWMDQCFLQLQLYPDESWSVAGSVSGNWIGAVVGWQIQAATGVEDPCFYTPLYAGSDVPGSGFLNLTQGDRLNVTMTGWPGDPSGELLTIKDLTHTDPANQSYAYAFNSTGDYPLDPAYTANDVQDALQWSTGGDLPVMFDILTGRAGNPSAPDNNSYGGCSPGPPPSTASNPAVPCPSYDPGSWVNDTLHPWEIDAPTFFNATTRSAPSAQVSFSQAFGGVDEVAALAGTACAGRLGSAYCSYPWFSYSCALGAFEFGATDFPGVSADFGKFDQYSQTLEHNAAQIPFYPAMSYSVPTCGGPSYTLNLGPETAGATVEFLNQAYGAVTSVSGIAPGEYQLESTYPTGGYFGHWSWTGGVVPGSPNGSWTTVTVTGSGSIFAVYNSGVAVADVTFKDLPSGEIAITPGLFSTSGGTTETVAANTVVDLKPGIYSILAYPPQGFEFSSWNSSGTGVAIAAPSLPFTWLVVTGSQWVGSISALYVRTVLLDRVGIAAYDPANSTFRGGTVSFGGFLTTESKAASGWIAIGTYNLSASPSPGFRFGGWYYTASSVMLNFSSNTNITLENGTLNPSIPAGVVRAIFLPNPVEITFVAVPSSGGVVVAGFGYVPSGGSLSLVPGANYTASASPGSGLGFDSWWTPDTTTVVWNRAPGTWTEFLVVNQTGTVQVNYSAGASKTLTFQVNPVGAGQIGFNGDNFYTNGDTNSTVVAGEAYLDSAIASTGSTFLAWSASGSVTVTHPSSPNSTVRVSGIGTLIAMFAATTFPVTILAVPPQPATFEVDGSGIAEGSTILLTPGTHTISVAAAGETFDSWSTTVGLAVTSTNSSSTTFTVSGPGALTALITPFTVAVPSVSPTPVDVGVPVNFLSTAPGGGSYAGYTPEWSGLPDGCPTGTMADGLTCAPSTAGRYLVTITFTDAWGEPATSPAAILQVNPLPTLTGPTLSLATIDAGVPTKLSAVVNGGTGPFEWSYEGLPGGCSTLNDSLLTCSPTQTGAFNVTVNVSDRFGETAEGIVHLVVNPLPSVQISASSTSISRGSQVTITTIVSGGTGPISLSYAGLPSGCPATVAASFSCLPTAAGTYHISVTARDAFGKTASQVLTLVVSKPSTSIWGLLSTEVTIGLALLVVIALVAFVALRRRPKKPTIVATPAAAPAPRITRPSSPAARPEWSEDEAPPKEWQEGQ